MKYNFTVKKMDVESGGKAIIVMNKEDAADIDLKAMDRIKLTAGSEEQTAIVDLAEKYVKKGEIGSFFEISKKMGLKNGQKITVEPMEKPASIGLIKKKMDGFDLNAEEIDTLIQDVITDALSDVELASFIAAVYIRGMTHEETIALTKSIVTSGTTLHISKKPILDKHCIGGVPGNRTTMIVVPIIAAAGLTIPKTSSRSITSPAGTADTMEVIAPVTLNEEEIEKVVAKTNGCIVWGGGLNLAAADDKLIQIRHPLSLDPRGMLLSSILAKKKAVGATHVLIDIPIGKGAKIYGKKEAEELARDFMDLGTKLDMEIQCIITPGYDPIGAAIGPALEAREVMRILEGQKVSPDLIEKSLVMAGIMLEQGGAAPEGKGRMLAQQILESGKALDKMREIIKAQGGNPKVKSDDILPGCKTIDIISQEEGRIHFINVHDIASICRAAGAPKDAGSGIYMYVEKGDKITKGQKLMTIYAESDRKLEAAHEIFDKTMPIELDKVVLESYSTEQKPIVYDMK